MKQFFIKTIIALIFVAILDGLFFIFTDVNTCPESVWAALIGLNVGYLMLFLIPICTPKEKGLMVLSAKLYMIGFFYFFVEFIVGTTFLFWVQPTLLWPVVIQASLLGIYIIVLLSSILANDATRNSIARQDSESKNIKFLAEQAFLARQMLEADPDAYRKLTKLYEDLKASPLRSAPNVAEIESQIVASLMALRNYAEDNDTERAIQISNDIRQLISQRNFLLKNIQHY